MNEQLVRPQVHLTLFLSSIFTTPWERSDFSSLRLLCYGRTQAKNAQTNKQTNKRIISEMKTDAASTVGHFVCEHVTPRHHRARLMTSSRATFRVNTLRVFAQTSTQRTYASGSLRDPLYHTRRVCTKLLNKSKISVT